MDLLSLDLPDIENPILPPPEKLFGFTYVSFFIEKTTLSAKTTAVLGGSANSGLGSTGKGGGFSLGSTFGRRGSEKNVDSNPGGREKAAEDGSTSVHQSATATAAAAAVAAARAAEEHFFIRISVYNIKGNLTEALQVWGDANSSYRLSGGVSQRLII